MWQSVKINTRNIIPLGVLQGIRGQSSGHGENETRWKTSVKRASVPVFLFRSTPDGKRPGDRRRFARIVWIVWTPKDRRRLHLRGRDGE